MKPEYFDIHSHINFPDYDSERAEVLARMKEQKVWTITVGTNLETSKSAVESTKSYDGLFATIGLHPVDDITQSFDPKAFKELVTHPKVVAIGECGLDYGRTGISSDEDKSRQKNDFERQIDFAVQNGKPVMLHIRNAHDDVLDILKSKKGEYGDKLWGNCHFFSGTADIAKRYLDLNFSLSFTGVITFATDYADAVRYVPLDMIMAETDAPFVAPLPYRGKRNEPAFVIEVVKKIAELKNLPLDQVKTATLANAMRIFKIPSLSV